MQEVCAIHNVRMLHFRFTFCYRSGVRGVNIKCTSPRQLNKMTSELEVCYFMHVCYIYSYIFNTSCMCVIYIATYLTLHACVLYLYSYIFNTSCMCVIYIATYLTLHACVLYI